MLNWIMLAKLLLLIGAMSLGLANHYSAKAFWRSEELWLDEEDVDEQVDLWNQRATLFLSCAGVCLFLSLVCFIVLWID